MAPNGYTSDKDPELTGKIHIVGSGTLYPLTKAMSDFFTKLNSGVNIKLESTGSTRGLEIFVNGGADICNASRSINAEELNQIEKKGIGFYEFPVVHGAITLIKNNDNAFLEDLTPEEVTQIYRNENPAQKWSDLRSKWPDEPIVVFGPKATHGTHDFFQEKILGKDKPFREDYNNLQEYADIVSSVADNKYAIGYVGVANYNNHREEVNSVPLRFGNEVIKPTYINVKKGRYKVLSRKMYLYVNAESAKRPEVENFLEMYFTSASLYSIRLNFIPFSDSHYKAQLNRLRKRNTGLYIDASS